MTIDVYSFDFDGCLANIDYLSSDKKDIIKSNQHVLDLIKQSANRLIVFVGSNRQSFYDDYTNSYDNSRGSCYSAIQTISNYLGAILDKFLLTDIYNNLASGTAFNEALAHLDEHLKDYKSDTIANNPPFPNWIHDESKLTILYAQMHKVALEHSEELIEFNFVDDRADLLENLHTYFIKYPELIPQNVRLNLKRYNGEPNLSEQELDLFIKHYEPVQGIGRLDFNYPNTVIQIAAVTIEQMNVNENYITAKRAYRPISSYAQAKNYHFNISRIQCIPYFTPGMIPQNPMDSSTTTHQKIGSQSTVPPTGSSTSKIIQLTTKTKSWFMNKFSKRIVNSPDINQCSSSSIAGSSSDTLELKMPSTELPYINDEGFNWQISISSDLDQQSSGSPTFQRSRLSSITSSSNESFHRHTSTREPANPAPLTIRIDGLLPEMGIFAARSESDTPRQDKPLEPGNDDSSSTIIPS